MIDNNLPLLSELSDSERIFFIVPYEMKNIAKELGCCFDTGKKMWFTGLNNSHLKSLTRLFEINLEYTSGEIVSKVAEKTKDTKDL